MNASKLQKPAGLSLIIGSIMMTVTMTFHPAGGSFQSIILHAPMSIATHGLAVLSVPFTTWGFWGLSLQLRQDSPWASLAFIFAAFGLFGAAIAALINGITLPTYVLSFGDEMALIKEQIRPVVRYGFYLNRAMDYLFIGGVAGAMVFFSSINLRIRRFPIWTSYLGLAIVAGIALVPFLVSITSLTGFRFVVFGIVLWTMAMGTLLRRLS